MAFEDYANSDLARVRNRRDYLQSQKSAIDKELSDLCLAEQVLMRLSAENNVTSLPADLPPCPDGLANGARTPDQTSE